MEIGYLVFGILVGWTLNSMICKTLINTQRKLIDELMVYKKKYDLLIYEAREELHEIRKRNTG